MHKINSAKVLESINNRSIKDQLFHRDLPVFPLISTETLSEYPLTAFFFGAEIHKLEIFKYLPLAKISTREIR